MLDKAAQDGVFLLNTAHSKDEVWDTLPRKMQQQITDKNLSFYVIDAYDVAAKTGMGRRINTVMQTCFFAISGILEKDEAITKIKDAVQKTYGKKGVKIVEMNFAAIDQTLAHLFQVDVPDAITSTFERKPAVAVDAPDFIQKITGEILAERGDLLPVSAIPADGVWPTGTCAYEKRNLATEIPVWDAELCIHCGKCPFVCPHTAIRSKVFPLETQMRNGVTQCLFYGLGSDGTVSANKNSIKIIGEGTELYGQGYFVYDSKKAGAVTVSHLRFGASLLSSS